MSRKGKKAVNLSHLDQDGGIRMVDVSDKRVGFRMARARGAIQLSQDTLKTILDDEAPKGSVLTTAKLAGIQAAKDTHRLIPLCHPLALTWVDVSFDIGDEEILITSQIKAHESTGLEMEALTAVSVAALTIYDMCKAIDLSMVIRDIRLVEKVGGESTQAAYEAERPTVAVVVISDSIAAGENTDTSGALLCSAFQADGCPVLPLIVIPDEKDQILEAVQSAIREGARLIVTSGGTGLGPRDVTVDALEGSFESRLPGVEQALHAIGQKMIPTAMLSRLMVGTMEGAIVVSLPGSPGAAKDAVKVLIPHIYHAFSMLQGHGHGH